LVRDNPLSHSKNTRRTVNAFGLAAKALFSRQVHSPGQPIPSMQKACECLLKIPRTEPDGAFTEFRENEAPQTMFPSLSLTLARFQKLYPLQPHRELGGATLEL
jgi:hypothetical protein